MQQPLPRHSLAIPPLPVAFLRRVNSRPSSWLPVLRPNSPNCRVANVFRQPTDSRPLAVLPTETTLPASTFHPVCFADNLRTVRLNTEVCFNFVLRPNLLFRFVFFLGEVTRVDLIFVASPSGIPVSGNYCFQLFSRAWDWTLLTPPARYCFYRGRFRW